MKWKQNLFFIIICCCNTFYVFTQNISVDDTYTPKKLIEDILINSTCVNVSNFSATGDNIPVGQNSYGYFNNNGGTFPFSEGVVLSTWGAKNSVGPFVFYRGDGNDTFWVGDPDIKKALGTGTNNINATVLEFDLTPLSTFLSFDYIFASNEYDDESPCQYADGFAFLIKEKGSLADYQNIALIPGTTMPVTTMNLHAKTPKGTCPPINESFFNGFNTLTSPINYAGQTVVMNANTNVVAGKTYHIKLVIADDINQYYDSAVFIKAGTLLPKIDLGPDRLIPKNPVCFGDNLLLDTKFPATNTFKWYKDNVLIVGAINPTYNVTTAGVYKVESFFTPSTCNATASIKIEYAPEIKLTDTTLSQCDPDGDGFSQFDLTSVDNTIRNNNTNLSSVVYYESRLEAEAKTNPILNPKTYINKTSNQVLIARVTDTYNCVNYAQLTLEVVNNYVPPQNPIFTCDIDANQDGLTQFDLNAQVSPQILSGLPNGLIVNYYLNETEAVLQTNALPNIFNNTKPYQQFIYVRIANGPSCYGIARISLNVNTFDPPNFQDETVSICDGAAAILTVASGYSSYLWSTGETTNSITITADGNYSVIVTDANGCTKTKNFIVPISGIATITDAIVNDFAANNNSVLLQFTGHGKYEFTLDSFYFQDNPSFSGVVPGVYNAIARDKNGCGDSLPFRVTVLDYPRFFTPNGDGYNENWTIKNLDTFPNAIISIFDRYGKLLKVLSAINPNWNGKYIDKELPSDDYWFQLKLDDSRIIKGHFSLKR